MKLFYRLIVVASVIVIAGCGHKGIYTTGYYSGRSAHWPAETHVVQVGETLYSIAWQYGQDYREVARWNDIASPYTIYPQQELRVSKPSIVKQHKTSQLTEVNKSVRPTPAATKTSYIPVKPANKVRPGSHKLNWQWPVRGKVLNRFSASDPGLKGIDIAGQNGAPIYAAEAGYVVYSGSGLRGYGKLIIIKHSETFLSAYAHNREIRVTEGEKVKKGEHIADMGKTGTETVKLHFEIRHNGIPVDPFRYLPKP